MPGRSYGGKKTGPDLSWADENDLPDDPNSSRATSPPSNVPGPAFPPRTYKHIIRTPKPASSSESRAVAAQLRFRQRCRDGPLFTVLDRNSLLVDGVSRKSEEAKRRGFDPFDGQDRYSTRHVPKRRTEPDLGPKGRGSYGGYSLNMFPEELWGVLDPETKLTQYWSTVEEGGPAWLGVPLAGKGKRKRKEDKKKRKRVLDYERLDREHVLTTAAEGDAENNDPEATDDDEDDDDVVAGSGRKRQRKSGTTKQKQKKTTGEKRGMEAEDDVDAANEPNPDENDEDAADEEPEDSDFSEDSDMNDYDAEQYFDAGEDEDEGGDDYGGADDY